MTKTPQGILVIGGLIDPVRTKDAKLEAQTGSDLIQIYDPTSEAFYEVSRMLNRRLGFTATALGPDSVLIFGGAPSWSYDKSQDKITLDAITTATELLVYRPRP